MVEIVPLGDCAYLARFDDEPSAAAWAREARALLGVVPGLTDVVLAYRSVGVIADAGVCDFQGLEAELQRLSGLGVECQAVRETAWIPAGGDLTIARVIDLPVLYDGEDLAAVAQHAGMGVEDVIALHAGVEYTIFAIGFLPGFPYAGYLPEGLSGLARRPSPRKHVAAGSVAIAGRQTGVYPQGSPGGWHLIGRTPLVIADLSTGHFPMRAGDRLRFAAIDGGEYSRRKGEWLEVEGRRDSRSKIPDSRLQIRD